MNNIKMAIKVIFILLIFGIVTSGVLSAIFKISLLESLYIVLIISGVVTYFMYQQHQTEKKVLAERAGQIDNQIIRATHQALFNASWGTNLQPNSPLYFSTYTPELRQLYIKIQIATTTRAPLTPIQKDLLRQAINADLQQILASANLLFQHLTIYPIYTDNAYEIVDIEVQL